MRLATRSSPAVLGAPIKRASLDEVWTLVRIGCPRAQRDQAIIALAGAEAETKHCGYSLDRQAELWGVAWATDLASAVHDLDRAAIAPAIQPSATARQRALARHRGCGAGPAGTRGAHRR